MSEKTIQVSMLVAFTIMIAESDPQEKETMVSLVMSFLDGPDDKSFAENSEG